MSRYQRVGDWLVENNKITIEQRDEALRMQQESKQRFGEVLISLGFISEREIVSCLAEQYDLPICDLKDTEPTETALRLVSPTFALSRLILPIRVTSTEFHCAICDPLDIDGTDYLTKALGKRLVISIAGPAEIFDAIARNYSMPIASKNTSEELVAKIQAQQVTEAAKAKRSIKSPNSRPPRKPKIHQQPDRADLLAAIAGTGADSLWDSFQD
jgi:type IV pilus assembly protein PilB